MLAIVTKYLPATERRPSRIVAKCGSKRIIYTYHSLTDKGQSPHNVAAKLFASEVKWTGEMSHACIDEKTYNTWVHVLLPYSVIATLRMAAGVLLNKNATEAEIKNIVSRIDQHLK